MNYGNLLERLNVKIQPLEKSKSEYKLIESAIESGQHRQEDFKIECIDAFTASRKKDKERSCEYEKTCLLWYGCLNSSVAAKISKGINKSYNKYTKYPAISLWDNVVACSKNIGMFNFENRQHNTGILMLCEVNYSHTVVPVHVNIDREKSADYLKYYEEYDEDQDTDDELTDNEITNTKKMIDDSYSFPFDNFYNQQQKFELKLKHHFTEESLLNKLVYCKDFNDDLEPGQLMKLSGAYSPPQNAKQNNIKIPIGNPVPSPLVQYTGWINGFLKVYDSFNHYLVSKSSQLKLKYLVIIRTSKLENNVNNKTPATTTKQTKSVSNSNNNNSNNNNIWDKVLTTKKRNFDDFNESNKEQDESNKDIKKKK
ncbi:hypothetical protein DLAC_02632 [Tieghemostelium lacteum]|uniref:Uncharacterized protein n=1 Tax=Tieghemostelium lacteum TaxID=361077 RepID=A0A152A327_TIELA|nr:hypothetical protein DLAC_02632 [Tieghemostelium lacteum]|eukprot:KYR00609.1 hypothetical protein DLAC_02632 [Tieghemostelium lacteum]